jgi:hypothetical protein
MSHDNSSQANKLSSHARCKVCASTALLKDTKWLSVGTLFGVGYAIDWH